MANWALVENNEIKETYDILPKSWRNVSGLRLAENDLEFLKSLGWYPVTKNHPEYDSNTHRAVDVSYTFENDIVTESLIIEEYENAQEILNDAEDSLTAKERFLSELRSLRDEKLVKTDFLFLQDVAGLMNQNVFDDVVLYRQALRNLPSEYLENEITSINEVSWPTLGAVIGGDGSVLFDTSSL